MRARSLAIGTMLAVIVLAGAISAWWLIGGQSETELDALKQRATALYEVGKHAEAVSLVEGYAETMKSRHGADHSDYAVALKMLAMALRSTNRPAEAEPHYRRALAIDEKNLGPEHPVLSVTLSRYGGLLMDINRLAEAEQLYRRALAIDEKAFGPDHPAVSIALNNLAEVMRATNRLADAEAMMRRALAIREKTFGPDDVDVALSLSNLGSLLQYTDRLAEAEPLLRRALAIAEKSLGPEHPDLAIRLNNLATVLQETGRVAEAELLYRRALVISEKGLGPEHPTVAIRLNNLAQLIENTGRAAEAEQLYRRAVVIDEKSLGSDHPSIATRLGNLAGLLRDSGRRAEAESLYRRAVAIDEKSLGPDHPSVATGLGDLGMVLRDADRHGEAEPLMRRALAIDEKSFGPEHRRVAVSLNNLGELRAELGAWAEAAELHRRAKPIMIGGRARDATLAKAVLAKNSRHLRIAARAVHRAGGDSAEAREEGFELAQWALQSGAADALAQMAVRFAKGGGPLAGLVRERQDLVVQRQSEDRRLLAALGNADDRGTDAIRAAIAALDARLDAADEKLSADFPDYAGLSNPRPLTIAAVQGLLKEDEALVVFLDVPHSGKLEEETLAWAVTRHETRWISVPYGTEVLRASVGILRCGLDRSAWSWSAASQRWDPRSDFCKALKRDGFADGEPLPFDLEVAHDLYARLLAPFADLTAGKRLIIVPSGPLTSLPFHVLVSAKPSRSDAIAPTPVPGDATQHEAEATPSSPKDSTPDYHGAAWLALSQPITVLPSVASLAALRSLPPSQASAPYIAFGNPLLDGDANNTDQQAWAKAARARQTCPTDDGGPRQRVAAARGVSSLGVLLHGSTDLAALRAQMPLPETAEEVCAVARSLGALAAQGAETETVWLGARATEANLKSLSRAGTLARARVLHFATHGLLAGESAAILKAKAEPALILTPPKDAVAPTALAEDDGLLTASEVAQLDLDADWVVLSACNTAAGEKGDAEALSGLARAFFYAKTRALLVSHWYVDSEAAVKLTTGAFDALREDPKIGRAEALRRSMARLISSGRPEEGHPEYWAPFVLVGEGAS